jgi:hypothetical protein
MKAENKNAPKPMMLFILCGLISLACTQVVGPDGPYPLKIVADVSRLFTIKHGVSYGQQKYDRLVLTVIPAVVKHIEDTFEAYDV